jgi:hypothetical protein
LPAVAFALIPLALVGPVAAAHDGTLLARFAFPDPSDCAAESRSADDVRAVIADAAATPAADT